jgi:hypothetical protein
VGDVKPIRLTVIGKVVLFLAVVTAALTIGVAPAAAAEVWHWEYRSGEVCAYHNSITDKSRYGGSYRSGVQAWGRNYTVMPPFWDCKWPTSYPANYLTSDLVVYKWDGYEWYYCREFGFHYNSSEAWSFLLHYEPGYSPCGSGDYGSDSLVYVYHNGEWKGGGPLWSGYEYIT